MSEKTFSPKDFLMSRRPERYSDSVIIERSILDRTLLEHHLATLNKRSQELAFESYAKRICEKTICPNLLEQTGPVAGGDGKVDTQTFPVSEQIRNLWYEGTNINESSHKERWAFAVSTQENWKAKCRKDIRKIKDTGRGYVKAFFVTNQYAKADQRSNIEDELKTETDIDICILDLNWLLDQTFKSDYIDIAIESLSIPGVSSNIVSQGPNDYRREKRLEDINTRISTKINPSDILVQQVDWFLDSAILSKECEKDILETQGLFDRAIRISDKFGTRQQKFDACYEYAWASLWWFEDVDLFETFFERAFQNVKESSNATRWNNFVTLLTAHHGYFRINKLTTVSIDIKNIRLATIAALEKIVLDETRPSNSLQARTLLVMIGLINVKSVEKSSSFFAELLTIAKESTCLIGYPFESLFDQMSELEFAFGEIEEYEGLLDFLTEHSNSRYSEIQISMKSLRRGAKKLENGKPYQAIKLIGKSLIGLYKKESRKNICIALKIISHAYSDVGLHWASRGSLLLASSLVTDMYWQRDEISPEQAISYISLTWSELKLGRVCHALSWFKIALILDANLEQSVIQESEYISLDAFMANIILNSELKDYTLLERLPDALGEVGLWYSRIILLYCLGYEKLVNQESKMIIDQEFTNFLLLARDYDFKIITPNINTFSARWCEIKSSVLGCEITVSFSNKTPFVELAESILSAIEGFCSTGLADKVIAIEPNLIIDIIADDDDDIKITHEVNAIGTPLSIEVTCSSFSPDLLNLNGQKIIQEWMHNFIIEVYCYIIAPINIEDNIESLLMNERALERSVSFTSSFTTQYNILGDTAVNDIASLLDKHKCFSMKRMSKWDSKFPAKVKEEKDFSKISFKKEEAIGEYLCDEKISHSDVKTSNLINVRLWDVALWGGTGFIEMKDGLPVLALLFENERAGKAVFLSLLSTIGPQDSLNRLRISIIQNVSIEEPFNYTVMLSENPHYGDSKRYTMISRINTMTPILDNNLKRFLSQYKKKGFFLLTYGITDKSNAIFPENFQSNSIIIENIILKDAQKIGPHDIEYVAIRNK